MDGKEVIDNIGSIYERFSIPPHLQDHMFRAAAVGKLICRNLRRDDVNEDDVVAVLLLHDLGNIVRFNFDNEDLNSLYGEKSDIEELRKIKIKCVEKYGEDDHEVTDKMCRELGVSERILELMRNHGFIRNREVFASDDFDLKICNYADQRIGPRGVLSLKVRFDEVMARASSRPWYADFDELIACASKLEEQILEKTNLSSDDINDDSIAEYFGVDHINS